MSVLELAAELAQLNPRQRKRLLASVPTEQRVVLTRLIQDMQPIATKAPDAFARLIADLDSTTPKTATWQRDSTVLAQLLGHESDALKRQLHSAFQGSGGRLTYHVTEIVAGYLETRLPQLPPAAGNAARRFSPLAWLQRRGKKS